MNIKLLLSSALIVVFVLSCKKKEDDPEPAQQVTQTVTESSQTLKTGVFTGYDHNLAGKASIVKDGGNHILRLTEYNMTSGPDVDLLLSKSASYSAANVVKISDLNGSYTNSDINFTLPSSLDWAQYPYVIVWCQQFSVNFGTANLVTP